MALNPADSANAPCGPANPYAKGPRDARYVENIMEHAFLSEVLQHCWFMRHHRVEVIRPEVDAGGYDLVLEANNRVRHVQLKSYSAGGAKGAPKLINARLRDHPDPCVVRISWKPNPETCRVDLQYRYSGWEVWPAPVDGAKNFELKGVHFVPGNQGFLRTPELVDLLFGSATS